MNILRTTGVMLLLVVTSVCNAQDDQASLDAACEAARQTALEPRRAEIYQECVDKFKKDAAECKAEAAGYNGNRAGASPLYYDLPECEAAFENRNKNP